jgi:hypothetical protein
VHFGIFISIKTHKLTMAIAFLLERRCSWYEIPAGQLVRVHDGLARLWGPHGVTQGMLPQAKAVGDFLKV